MTDYIYDYRQKTNQQQKKLFSEILIAVQINIVQFLNNKILSDNKAL